MLFRPDSQNPNRREQLRRLWERSQQALERARDPLLRIVGVVSVAVGAASIDDQIMDGLVELHRNIPTSLSRIVQTTRALGIPDELVSISFMGGGAGMIASSSERVRERIRRLRQDESASDAEDIN